MKSYTPSLMNVKRKRPKFWSILWGKPFDTGFYVADHKEKDIHLMFMEASQFGPTFCYPCVLEEGDKEVLSFHGTGSDKKQFNDALIQRWVEVISPETVDQYVITEMEQQDFYDLLEVRAVPREFRAEAEEHYRKKKAMREARNAMKDGDPAAQAPAAREEAAPAAELPREETSQEQEPKA